MNVRWNNTSLDFILYELRKFNAFAFDSVTNEFRFVFNLHFTQRTETENNININFGVNLKVRENGRLAFVTEQILYYHLTLSSMSSEYEWKIVSRRSERPIYNEMSSVLVPYNSH